VRCFVLFLLDIAPLEDLAAQAMGIGKPLTALITLVSILGVAAASNCHGRFCNESGAAWESKLSESQPLWTSLTSELRQVFQLHKTEHATPVLTDG
jgi:hypothetical protein